MDNKLSLFLFLFGLILPVVPHVANIILHYCRYRPNRQAYDAAVSEIAPAQTIAVSQIFVGLGTVLLIILLLLVAVVVWLGNSISAYNEHMSLWERAFWFLMTMGFSEIFRLFWG